MNEWYISGPMRGYKHFNFPMFREAEAYLGGVSCGVFNPARHDAEVLGMGWEPDETQAVTEAQLHSWMRKDLGEVAASKRILLLPGWEHSQGARREAQVAAWCGLSAYGYQPDKPEGTRLAVVDVGAVLSRGVDTPDTVSPMSDVLERTDVANEEYRTKADGWASTYAPEGYDMHDPSSWIPLSERTTYSEAALLDQIEHSQRSQHSQHSQHSQGYPPLRTTEQNEVLGIFMQLLAGPTGDGGSKRARGEKPSWKVDEHLARGAGHLHRYLHEGERFDKDSGCHPLAHAAWRFLAVAYQDMVAAGALPADPSDSQDSQDC